jgi:hypothetical protein
MKIAKKYIRCSGALLLIALLVFSCAEFEEFESTTFGSGPTVSLAQVSAQDSSFTVSVTSSADGFASVILLPGTGNTVPDPEDLLTENVASLASQTKKVQANQPTNFTFSGLIQWATWEVMAAANNADGKVSDVEVLAVNTEDSHAPVLSDTDPGVTYDAVLPVGGPVTLVFDEPVLYDDSKDVIFTEFYDGQDVAAASVEIVDYFTAVVTPGEDFSYYDYVLLSYPEGAFTDYAGNPIAEMTSYFDSDAGALVGLFWGVEFMEYDAASITPDADTVQNAAFDIVITFDDAVDASNVADGDITIAYTEDLNTLIKGVLASEISAADKTLTITQSYTAASGAVIDLTIPAEILEIGYGNPNVEITASWVVE